MAIGPNTALALSFSGILGIYLELFRPGRAIAGCAGIALLLWGAYRLWLFGPTVSGSLLLALAAILFVTELLVNSRYLAGATGTAALFAGLKLLLPSSHALNTAFTLSVSLILGLITTLFCISAREARRSKRADLGQSA
jgi:membrane-bound ClpP family serine protease